MSAIFDLRAYADSRGIPTLVLADMQREYVATPRGLAIRGIARALANCRVALAHARATGIPVAFSRWTGRSTFFNRATPFAGWIEGFEPLPSDMIFERERPSCYANENFSDMLQYAGGHMVLAGFAGESACLSTIVDAFHRDHRITYLADASASHDLGDVTAADVHRAVSGIAGLYANVLETERWIASTSRYEAGMGGANGRWLQRET